MKEVILVGGGGFCKSVADVVENAGYNIMGILDKPEEVGKKLLRYEVIGTDDDIPSFVGKAEFVITVGHIKNSLIRQKIYDRIKMANGTIATIVAKDAYVSPYAKIGEGCLIMHKAMVGAEVELGVCTIINTLCNISHEAKIGSFCHISTCASVNGACVIPNDTFIGSQSVINQGIKLSIDGCVIASLSVVNKDITEKGVYAGSPAKLIRQL